MIFWCDYPGCNELAVYTNPAPAHYCKAHRDEAARIRQRERDRRWRERHPEKARESNRAKVAKYKADPEVREVQRLKRIARYHGITLDQARERDAARKSRQARDARVLSAEHYNPSHC